MLAGTPPIESTVPGLFLVGKIRKHTDGATNVYINVRQCGVIGPSPSACTEGRHWRDTARVDEQADGRAETARK